MFFKKKKANRERLDDSFAKVTSEIDKIDKDESPAQIRKYLMESCEHIISTAKEIDSLKTQIKLVEEYRGDVRVIMNLPAIRKKKIKELADNIKNLSKRKKDYQESEKRITDDTFILMQENEDTVVDDIKRMEENEIYYEKLSKRVRAFEGDKGELEVERREISVSMGRYRMLSMAIFILVVGSVISSFFIPGGLAGNVRLIFMIIMFVFVFLAFLIFMVMGRKRKEFKQVTRELNQVISLLNVERMRMVNVKRALDYEMKYYDVRSSGELTYLWEQYLLTVKELESNRRNNLDLRYYLEKMYGIFKDLNLVYEKKWVEQISFVTDEVEIIALNDKLVERVIKLQNAIEDNSKAMKAERSEIDRLMKEYNFYVPEVLEILATVDRVLNKNDAVVASVSPARGMALDG